MSATPGQARGRGAGAVLLWLMRALGVLVLLAVVAVGALAVWLGQGQVDVTRLAQSFAPHTPGRQQVAFARADLFWDRHRKAAPLVLTLNQPVLRRADGSVMAQAATAQVSVLFAKLLVGQLRPVAIGASNGSVSLLRKMDGTIGLDDGSAPTAGGSAPAATAAKPRATGAQWSQLRHVMLAGLDTVVTDRVLNTVWRGRVALLDIDHIDTPRMSGQAAVSLQAGPGRTAQLVATLSPLPAATELSGTVTGVDPADLARPDLARSGLAAAAAFDVPLSAQFRLVFARQWQVQTLAAGLHWGAGRLVAGGGMVPVASGQAELSADVVNHRGAVQARLVLAGPSAPGPVLNANAALAWSGQQGNVNLDLTFDRLAFADLARYWPPAAGKGARAWMVANATAGIATGGHFSLGLGYGPQGVVLNRASGGLRADDLTLYWLRPVPPITHAGAVLQLQSPDALLITLNHGIQAPSDPAVAATQITGATMQITGLSAPDQLAVIDANLVGPVGQSIALLRADRLHLLAAHPLDLGVPSGTLMDHLTVRLPLENKVTIDQIAIHATGRCSDLHLGGLIGGKDLDDGALGIDVTNNRLALQGTAQLAGVPSKLLVTMDFRAGPPDQVVASYQASGSAGIAALQAAGLPASGLASGSVDYTAAFVERRGGRGEARVHVDLRAAKLDFDTLGWHKAADTDTVADARVVLDHDQLVGVDNLSIEGPDVAVEGHASYQQGKPVALTFDRIVLGKTRAAGELRFPTPRDPRLHATLHGSVLDLSARLKPGPTAPTPGRAEARAAARQRRSNAASARRGQPWKADLAFDQVLLGPGRGLGHVKATAEDDGLLIRRSDVAGVAGAGAFHLSLAPQGTARVLQGSAQDAGGLLRALGLVGSVQGGTLTLNGVYDDTLPDHPLAGTALIDAFRITGAASVAKVLQAMTLYGVVDVLRGPGLGITHLVAPFGFADDVLTLTGARAFSGSLGFTAKGDVDLAAQRLDMTGTIVPAYFFNTLLGHVPLVGKLFSPETGGGVFAATYGISGAIADPKVHVNPLAALTPGFLRGLFGIFDTGKADAGTPAPASPPASTQAP